MLRPQANRVFAAPLFTRRVAVFTLLLLCAPALYLIIGNTSENGLYSAEVSTKYSIDQMKNFAFRNSIATDFKPSYYTRWNYSYSKIVEVPENRFNISGEDVIVFLHIQKTAGTSFEKYLVKFLDLERPCHCSKGKKRCTCRRPNRPNETWLFSRYSTGWVCGLHADFTELFVSNCVDTALDKKEGTHRKRRYFYTSFLREPIARFISEYRHVNRGATWIASRHVCNGRPPTPDELPLCFDPQMGWEDVSLDEFLHCPFNLAFNRQTRMLADLTLVNCYSRNGISGETRDRIMLESAKNNLRNLAFFGIKENMEDSQFMFEQLFGLRFTKSLAEWSKSKSNGTAVSEAQMKIIRERNKLDLELYEYAVKLFNKRLKQMKNDVQIFQTKPSAAPRLQEDIFFVRNPPPPPPPSSQNASYEYTDSYETYEDDHDRPVQFKRV